MEITVKNLASRLLLEKADNGVILSTVNEDGSVTSKLVYELYYDDGLIDFEAMSVLFGEIMASLNIPVIEEETNKRVLMMITKIDPEKPMVGEDDETDEDE